MNPADSPPRRELPRASSTGPQRARLSDLTSAEVVAVAIRRSRIAIVLAIVVGTLGVLVGRQLQSPRYNASARVLITTDISSAVSELQQAFRDPVRALATEQQIAGSHDFFVAAARQGSGRTASATFLENAVTVAEESGSDVLTFTAVTDSAATAISAANTVVSAFPAFRTQLRSREIDAAIRGLRAENPATTAAATERQKLIDRLDLLRKVNGGAVVLDRSFEAKKTRPAPLRDGLLGLALGLLVAAIVVGAREVLRTRARSAAEVEGLLGTPVLSLIPPAALRGGLPVFGASRESFEPLFRSLATTLHRAVAAGRDPVIGVTSAGDDRSAALVATSLAVTIARSGGLATLIDVMPDDNPIAGTFGASGSKGAAPGVRAWNVAVDEFAPHASNPLSIGDALRTKDGVTLIESGSFEELGPFLGGQTPSGSIRFGWTIALLPPALASGAAIALSRQLDGIIAVVRQDSVPRRNLRALAGQSDGWSCPLLGAVLSNAVSEEAIVPDTRASSR